MDHLSATGGWPRMHSELARVPDSCGADVECRIFENVAAWHVCRNGIDRCKGATFRGLVWYFPRRHARPERASCGGVHGSGAPQAGQNSCLLCTSTPLQCILCPFECTPAKPLNLVVSVCHHGCSKPARDQSATTICPRQR
jgi:hypothetical protein